MAPRPLSAEERAKVFKALSDPRRIDIVDALSKRGAMCGTELSEELGVSLALLCHHWDVLVEAGLVEKNRVGQLRMCSLNEGRLREATGSWEAPRAEPSRAVDASKAKPKRALAARDAPKQRDAKPKVAVKRAAKRTKR